MRRLFVEPACLRTSPVVIEGPDHHHLAHVLRVREGEPLVLLDGQGCAWHARVLSVGKRTVSACVEGPAEAAPEPAVHITVAQAIGKGDRFEEVLEHGTEAGASAFVPLVTERTVVRLRPEESAAKLVRWRTVVKGAAEQSGRARIPRVLPPTGFDDLLARDPGPLLLLHPEGEPLACMLGPLVARPLGSAEPRALTLAVGPEGGFSLAEVMHARQAGAGVVSLGPRVLRTETAALVAVAQVLYAAAQPADVP